MPSHLSENRRVDALFKTLSSDFLLREQFVTDPAQILSEYVTGTRLEPDEAAAANQLVYAVVSNPGMLRWLRAYGQEHRAMPPSDEAFARDFARALARQGDEQALIAVLRAAGEDKDLFSVQASVLRGLIAAFGSQRGSVFGTEQSSPGTEVSSPGTEVSTPGTEVSSPGTEVSPGAVFAGTEQSSPGTERSPGPGTEASPAAVFAGTEQSSPGTERSPGPGTEQSPGAVFAGTEQSPSAVFAGTEQSSPGTEISPGPGTEQSPGAVFAGTEQSSPGTEISPGPGTDMSPGRFGGFGTIDHEVTLAALVDFAQELRRAGALDSLAFG